MSSLRIEPSWEKRLTLVQQQAYFRELRSFVRSEYSTHTVYPEASDIFRAFDMCPFDDVRVVIIGQDPYHGVHQACGLSFAVQSGIPLPPSLQNIFREIHADIGIAPYMDGDLTRWARQGVLLLNALLTVRAGSPGSHRGKGWEQFTDEVIVQLNAHREHIVYMLWGKYAQAKCASVDTLHNLVLVSGHPSPYSAHLFRGQHHFSRCNKYLQLHGNTPIDWR